MCKAIGAGLVEFFGEGNESVMYGHGPKAMPDPSLTPTTCTGERRWAPGRRPPERRRAGRDQLVAPNDGYA